MQCIVILECCAIPCCCFILDFLNKNYYHHAKLMSRLILGIQVIIIMTTCFWTEDANKLKLNCLMNKQQTLIPKQCLLRNQRLLMKNQYILVQHYNHTNNLNGPITVQQIALLKLPSLMISIIWCGEFMGDDHREGNDLWLTLMRPMSLCVMGSKDKHWFTCMTVFMEQLMCSMMVWHEHTSWITGSLGGGIHWSPVDSSSQRTNNVEHWCFLYQPEKGFHQTFEVPVTWITMGLMWCHCYYDNDTFHLVFWRTLVILITEYCNLKSSSVDSIQW